MYKSATEMRGVSQTRERERENTGGVRAAMSGGAARHTRGRGLGQGNEQGHTHTYTKGTERDETRLRGETKNKDFFWTAGEMGRTSTKNVAARYRRRPA